MSSEKDPALRRRHFGNVVAMGWVSLFTDISSEMLYAVTPLFLTSVLGASAGIVGLIEGIAEGTASVLKGVSGWYSDRVRKRKRLVFVGYSLSSLAKPLIAIAMGWPLVLVARFLDRLGKGIRTAPRDALIADSIEKESLGRAFGLHRAMDTTGALIGVGISLGLLYIMRASETEAAAMRSLYWIAFLPAVLGVLFILRVREIVPKPTAAKKRIASFSKRYYGALALFSVMTLGLSSDAFMLLRARNVGWSAEAVIGAYLCYTASFALISYPAGKLADRLRKEMLLGLGMLVYAGVYLGLAMITSPWLIWPLFLFYGLYSALTDGVGKALIAGLVPSEARATALGVFQMVTGIMSLLASIVAGVLWDAVSPATPFYLGAALAVIGGVGFLIWRPSATTT